MSIVNNLEDNPTTHVNLKSGLNRALDIAFTNFPEKVTNFVIEYDLEITPYSKIFKNNLYLLYFTDHLSILIHYCLGDQIENVQPEPKQMLWQYAPDGDVAFEYLMDEGAEYIMDLVEKCDDVEEIVQRVEKCIK